MNIYEKVQNVKILLLQANLKKTGYNSFNRFRYYELSDFMPKLIQLSKDFNLCTLFDFTTTEGILTIINSENPKEKITCRVPMVDNEIKGCNPVQNLGGAMTYLKRYLLTNAFDIIENDMYDSQNHYTCNICNKQLMNTTKEQIAEVEQSFGMLLCKECRAKRRKIICPEKQSNQTQVVHVI